MKIMQRILPLLAILLMVGCTSLYTGIVTFTSVVDAAMKDWASLSAKGQTGPKVDAAVTAAHDRYRAAAGVAQTALIAYKAGGNQQDWLNALAAVKASAGDLINMIVPLVTPSRAATLTTQLSKASTL